MRLFRIVLRPARALAWAPLFLVAGAARAHQGSHAHDSWHVQPWMILILLGVGLLALLAARWLKSRGGD